MKLPRAWPLLLGLLSGCGASTNPSDAAALVDSAIPDDAGCTGQPELCFVPELGDPGPCTDVAHQSACTNGQRSCPSGGILASHCTTIGATDVRPTDAVPSG